MWHHHSLHQLLILIVLHFFYEFSELSKCQLKISFTRDTYLRIKILKKSLTNYINRLVFIWLLLKFGYGLNAPSFIISFAAASSSIAPLALLFSCRISSLSSSSHSSPSLTSSSIEDVSVITGRLTSAAHLLLLVHRFQFRCCLKNDALFSYHYSFSQWSLCVSSFRYYSQSLCISG